jgi:hypothetical protein
VTPLPDPLLLAAQVCTLLGSLNITYSVGGSIASSLSGEPRSSVDIDIVVLLEATHVGPLADALEPEFYVHRPALERAIARQGSVNVIHRESSIKIDLFVAGGSPIDEDTLRRRMNVMVGDPSTRIYVHTPEDILLQKLRWYRLGGDVSDRQWRDVLGIVRVQGTRLDSEHLTAGAQKLAVEDLLGRALREGGWSA